MMNTVCFLNCRRTRPTKNTTTALFNKFGAYLADVNDALLIVHVRYINILTSFQGFQDKPSSISGVVFFLYPSLFWELRDKRNLKFYKFDPEALEPC